MYTSRELPFVKYQGLGNDFIIFLKEDVLEFDWADLARQVCDRHFGIGADGMVVLSKAKYLRMDFYNSDGSEAPMCGNASRCVSQFAKNIGLINQDKFTLQTKGGDLLISLLGEGIVSVNLGKAKLNPVDIPANWDQEKLINEIINIGGKELQISAVFMTTPHAVIFVDEISEADVLYYGPIIENLSIFPNKISANFVEIVDENTVKQATWERGAGRTLACGTGSCATVTVGNITNRLASNVKVEMDGGYLEIEYAPEGVLMTGQVQKIAEGVYYYHCAEY